MASRNPQANPRDRPEVVEDWKWRGIPVWSHEGMYANAFKEKVKVTFFHGAQIPYPSNLINAGLRGNKWRAIGTRKEDKIDETPHPFHRP